MPNFLRLALVCSVLSVLAPGCGGPTGGSTDDTGGRDGATTPGDTGVPDTDSGVPDTDTGVPDTDSGVPDTGVPDTDSGVPDTDSGVPDTDSGTTATDAGCAPPVCPVLPTGCSYVGGTACACGAVQCVPPTGCSPACRRSDYCAFADGTCGSAGGGTCMTPPDACIDIFDPVCGCDGMTYGNSCEAAAAGQNVALDGACPTAADCRTTGCPARETCTECRGGAWVCFGPGTTC